MMLVDEMNAQSVDNLDADIDRDGEWILSVKGVGRRFSGLQALDDVDMTVNRDEVTSFIGPNGTGKTTLLNRTGEAFSPTNGTVRLNGEVISGLLAHKIARAGLTRTFQITRPPEKLTAVENAMVGAHIYTRRRSEAREIAMESLESIGLADKAKGEAGEFTMGTRKHLELARIVSTRPETLFLDEIMVGLTPSESNQMLDLFRQFRERGANPLIIEHDMKAITNTSDYVKVLDQRKGIIPSAPEMVVKDDRAIEAYIGGFDVDA